MTVIFGETLVCEGSTFCPEGSTVLATPRDPLVDLRNKTLTDDLDPDHIALFFLFVYFDNLIES